MSEWLPDARMQGCKKGLLSLYSQLRPLRRCVPSFFFLFYCTCIFGVGAESAEYTLSDLSYNRHPIVHDASCVDKITHRIQFSRRP